MTKNLHIVSFDVPFPANYGGVIDVFYKIKALHKLGVKIWLHTYEYGRGKQDELLKYCEKITYYKRSKSPLNLLSRKPFIVKSRRDSNLIKNLKKDNNPILFEGLHTTYPLIDFDFKDRIVLIRSHNIEHKYYDGLAKSTNSISRKSFFKQEARKLKHYEKIVKKANYILTISPFEQHYFTKKYGSMAKYIPVFHKNEAIVKLSDTGKFALYHGDLRVSDNEKAACFLIDVFKKSDVPLTIASSYSNAEVETKIKEHSNIKFVFLNTKNNQQLDTLFTNAHINVLPTFQKTGIKLKLIHALFQSRFCVVNSAMVIDTGLESLCEIADTPNDFLKAVSSCFTKNYDASEMDKRKQILKPFNTLENAKKIVELCCL